MQSRERRERCVKQGPETQQSHSQTEGGDDKNTKLGLRIETSTSGCASLYVVHKLSSN